MRSSILLLALVACVAGEIYFKETFDGDWEKRWVKSTAKGSDHGKYELSAGQYHGDATEDVGLKTMEDYRFYHISAKMDKVFDNEDKTLVIQYSAKHEQKIDCGGGYIKIFPEGHDQEKFDGDSSYNVMFGPDICGTSTRKTHVIFGYKGKNLLTKKDIRCETDELTHLYTLIVRPDKTYEVLIDNKKVDGGELTADFDFLKPKQIRDPSVSKPSDWVDNAEMDDPEDKKPEGYDDIPKEIADPDAKKPDDWDEESDGEWEAPMISNPEYKGAWKAKKIPNPEYKGKWEAPLIDNPDFEDDPELHIQRKMAYIGFELWQVKAGTIFDNIIVTDDVEEAKKFAEATTLKSQPIEKKLKQEADDAERKKQEEERKKREEEEAKKKAQEGDDDDDDDDDDEDDDKERKKKLDDMKSEL